MERPIDLPIFRDPPLNEVALGVQFSPPRGLKEIYARDVWAAFEAEFPIVEMQPPLLPQFETFGGTEQNGPRLKFEIGPKAQGNRYWFIQKDNIELLQYQTDRFLHNWRKQSVHNEYPHFEKILPRFESEIRKLSDLFILKGWGSLIPNQCEVTYINHLYANSESGADLKDLPFLAVLNTAPIGGEVDVNFAMRKILFDDKGMPFGRLYIEANKALDEDGRPLMVLSLIVRGAPAAPSIDEAMKFLINARRTIVTTFKAITTANAHIIWGLQG